jgi:gas vesicle protein
MVKRFGVPLLLLGIIAGSAIGDTRRLIEQPVRQSIVTRKETQQEEAQWRREKEKLIAQYEQLQQQQNQLQQQKSDLLEKVAATRTRVAAKEKQLADIEEMTGHIRPLLEELITQLKLSISNDPPFLTEERRQRMERLDRLMANPDVTISETYRKVMEALQVEAEYGFTIETYQETIVLEEQSMLADIFRFGRLGLYCLSLDRKQGGFFNPAADAWQPLAASHRQALHTAIAIAAKQQPVELLNLPLGRLVVQ